MKRCWPTLILVVISSKGIAQPQLAQRDPVLIREKAIAGEVEGRAHIDNFDLQTNVPEIRIDAGRSLSFYGMGTGNVVHEEHWGNVSPAGQVSFTQWASFTSDEPTGKPLFEDMFYRFFFVQ